MGPVAFYVCEKVEKTFWFSDLFIYERQWKSPVPGLQQLKEV